MEAHCRVPPFDPVGLWLFALGFRLGLGLSLCFGLCFGLGGCRTLDLYSLLFLHLCCALGFGLAASQRSLRFVNSVQDVARLLTGDLS